MTTGEARRPDPDELLARLEADAAQSRRGKLKIFFGASPGVGKTYAMLVAARTLAGQGVDIVVGVAETHGRPETAELIRGLATLPPRIVDYKGHQLLEFDLDAALTRAPRIVLVDELAHSNAPGARHPKRWQDVEELLAAGIDVFTTVNVQHLESLNDVVGGITGIKVRETLPDHVFDDADEVVLVDLPHEELLQRLKEGKVYLAQQAEIAVHNFFRKGNLLALRELALRRTADRVDVEVQAYRREQSVATVWPTRDSLLVCVGAGVGSKRLVRAGARLAAQLDVPWHAIYIATAKLQHLPEGARARILRTLKLAQDLGATTASLSGDDPIAIATAYAREHNLGKVVVGRETARLWPWQRSFAERIGKSAPELEVILVAREGEDRFAGASEASSAPTGRSAVRPWHGYLWACAGVALVTVAATPLLPHLDLANIVMLFLSLAVVVAYRFGRGPGALTAVLSVAAFDFFFVQPRLSFAVSDFQYLPTFAVMLVVALLIGQLTARLKFQAAVALSREQRIRALFEMTRELASALAVEQIAEISQRFVRRVSGARSTLLALDTAERLHEVGSEALSEIDLGIAHYALEHNEPAGCSTSTLPSATALYLPLKAPMRTRGVLVLAPEREGWTVSPEQQRLLETSAGLIAIALERVHFISVAQETLLRMESEQLRNSLLSALSHDLRTPLTVLHGLAESLNLAGPPLPRAQADIAQAIRDEALRTSVLVSNLLDMARLQSGEVSVNREWQPLEEVVGVALQSRASGLAGHTVNIRLPADLPLMYFDAILMERVFCNLLENAAKYTPRGSVITVSARRHSDRVEILVEDNGPGLPPGKEETLFAKFARGKSESSVCGVGLGLSIVRAIVEAHDGTIRAENRHAGGARFIISLPAGSPPEVPEEEAAC
ncbi:two-component system sensor histidine kinase KdpD [Accumulibacter sp.]|uniref:two-component system sensor histidine kinase KdpD n=1 Tax=Accumulibacter sp. TaxID=2053492 RepID=UPI0025DF7633|nr:two-component system sensor histidine kinase KdpD [Accumulibacter sp.]MCM8595769.1 two-component system sensor histidine kinase KdpD [Accumulibacter sp.]MCM8626491.1 two-component system sensor histidine kinase KdpD [Accumulibacter sp.]MDS4049917.1 two-component system sensor histidine kinase KdpD [Accumulibacter sp.]